MIKYLLKISQNGIKTKYEWQGDKIIADFGNEDKLEIQFEKI